VVVAARSSTQGVAIPDIPWGLLMVERRGRTHWSFPDDGDLFDVWSEGAGRYGLTVAPSVRDGTGLQ